MKIQDALNEMQGKEIKSIQHHDVIDLIEFHFSDGSCVSVKTKDESTAIMLTIPKGGEDVL